MTPPRQFLDCYSWLQTIYIITISKISFKTAGRSFCAVSIYFRAIYDDVSSSHKSSLTNRYSPSEKSVIFLLMDERTFHTYQFE